jgi:CBS domain containing-hemolysin-like protein
MSTIMVLVLVALACLATLAFATLSYSVREISRVRLAAALEKRHRAEMLEVTIDRRNELVLATAIGRLAGNTIILLGALYAFEQTGLSTFWRYALSVLTAGTLSLLFSVALPHAMARYSADAVVASTVDLLHALRLVFLFITIPMNWIDDLIRKAVGASGETEAEDIEQEILSAVEEGAAEGIVGDEERQMIESVIKFRETNAGQIMTARPEIVGVELTATIDEVKRLIEQTGHSRIVVYDGTLDHIAGVLYARDLVRYVGVPAERLDLRAALRPPLYVPETKPLRDLLADFRSKKVHIAVVLDEYGGTAGLITIEDVLEELVGEISDEHEPVEPAMFRRLSEQVVEADARSYIDELNRLTGFNLPEDAGYDTLGGFVSTTLGRIPGKDESFESHGAKFTVLDAEPQKVNRVRIEVIPQPAEEMAAPEGM